MLVRQRGMQMRMSEFFVSYVCWIMRQAQRRQIKRLYFFTREGEFFKKLYDHISKYEKAAGNLPTAQVLEVSRMSTFFPSVRKITVREMMRMWRQYPMQSMRTFCQSLNMELDSIQSCLNQYEISADELIRQPWKDSRIRQMFADASFVQIMERERDQKRSQIFRYLKQHGWSRSEAETIGIVDIGWKGTIQDNLCYLYPNYKIAGFYLGLQPFLSEQPVNARKYGYLDDCPLRHTVLLTVRPLEMLCGSPNGSVTAYAWDGQTARAIRKKDRKENDVFRGYSMPMQRNMLKQVDVMIKKIEAKTLEKTAASDTVKHQAHDLTAHAGKIRCQAYRFIAYPDRNTVHAYFSLYHNEQFGQGGYVQASCRFRPALLLKAAVSGRGRREFKAYLKEVSWPQAYFVKYWLYPLLIPYNYLLLKYLNKKNDE